MNLGAEIEARPERVPPHARRLSGLRRRSQRTEPRDSSAIVSASVKDDHKSATSPAAKPPRSCQSSGNATMPPPTNTNDIAKVMCKKLIRMKVSCTEETGRKDMVTASLRMSSRFEL
ncbi:hypothetical protein [Bradyrhizobium sp.]|uniref:hypothetical protein n=1 Tax=Bradyrhizobium sp. TaxID=376 RepID=UPI0039193E50